MLSWERLHRILRYDPVTGVWTWLHPETMNKKPISAVAGTISVHGYRIITFEGVKYRAARLAWFYMTGEWPAEEIDHENRIKDDDRWINLRDASRSENSLNRDLQSNNTSGARGIHWNIEKEKWYMAVKKDGVSHFGGNFDFLDEAIEARNLLALELQGPFAMIHDPFCQADLYDRQGATA